MRDCLRLTLLLQLDRISQHRLLHATRRMEGHQITEDEVRVTLTESNAGYPGNLDRPASRRGHSPVGGSAKVVYNRGLEGEGIVVTVECGRPAGGT